MRFFKKKQKKTKPPQLPLKAGDRVSCNFPDKTYRAQGTVVEADTTQFRVKWHPGGSFYDKFTFDEPIKWEWGWLEGDTHGDNPVSRIRKEPK